MTKKYYAAKRENIGVWRTRVVVKGFMTGQAMHKFLNGQFGKVSLGNQYVEHAPGGLFRDVPQKSGTYVFLGGKYVNVKELDACELAHV